MSDDQIASWAQQMLEAMFLKQSGNSYKKQSDINIQS